MFKKRLLMSLVILMLVACAFGSVKSLATEITAGNVANTAIITTIKPANNTVENTAANNVVSITSALNNVKANNVVNNTANTSNYASNKANTTKLPYAGTNSSMVFFALAFMGSAIYAYKKITEYNV